MSTSFDVVVIGAGPGGYVAAIRAAQLGQTVAIAEPRYWGGVCLNVGCVPAKTLLRTAEVVRTVTTEADAFGISGDITVDFGAAFSRSRAVAAGRTKGVHYLMRKNGITEFSGVASFVDAGRIEVTGADGGVQQVGFASAVIATGATPRLLPGVVLSERVVTYETLIMRAQLPESLLIIGGGAIGVEFASVYRAYGVEVTIVEFLERILPNEDDDVSKELHRRLEKDGARILVSTRVTAVVDSDDHVEVQMVDATGAGTVIVAGTVLVATGFAPFTDGLALDRAGVELDDRGAIVIDDHMRTTAPNIFAIGDVTAKLQLAHVAETQGVVAAETIAGAETVPISDYRMFPRATFTTPQVASFGLTEAQARDGGGDITVSVFPFAANAKAHALGDAGGFVKLIADAEFGRLLGGHMIGPDVSELLPELTLAERFELTAEEIVRNVHTHPTLSESLLEAAHGLLGHQINL